MPKVLSIFNEYLHRGGEAEAVDLICDSLKGIVELKECRFYSADWVGKDAPGRIRQAIWLIRNPNSLAKLRKIHSEFRPDAWLVHNVFPVGSAGIYTEAERLNVPIIQYLHNFRPFSVNGYLWAGNRLAPGGLKGNFFQEIRHGAWQESRLKTAWFAFVLKRMHARGLWRTVRAWVAASDFVRDKVIEAGLPASDVFTLPYPWRMQNAVADLPAEENYYLFLGRLIDAKGIRVLIESWTILEQRFKGKAPNLVIAGSGPLERFVKEKASQLRRVQYVGQISGERKRQALQGARAVIAPSLWWEAFGLIAYEAFDYGKPLLAAKSGGLQETVSPGRTGLLHDPGDAECLAEQVVQLEQNPSQRHEMGREGRCWLEINTNRDQWQNRFAEIVTHATR
jgi:glycosyltransferase involved in cell wall biosynthesis